MAVSSSLGEAENDLAIRHGAHVDGLGGVLRFGRQGSVWGNRVNRVRAVAAASASSSRKPVVFRRRRSQRPVPTVALRREFPCVSTAMFVVAGGGQ